MELGEATIADADVVVILGGMAMPKIGVKPEEMKDFLTKIKYKKLIGVCFMSIFEKSGWCETLPFDFVMNMILEGIQRYPGIAKLTFMLFSLKTNYGPDAI